MFRCGNAARIVRAVASVVVFFGTTVPVLANSAPWYPRTQQPIKFVRPPTENQGPTEVFNLFEIRRDPQATRPKLLLPKSWLANNMPKTLGKTSAVGPTSTSTIVAGSALSLAMALAGLTWFSKTGRTTLAKYGACAVALIAATSGGYTFANLAPFRSGRSALPVDRTHAVELTSPRVVEQLRYDRYYHGFGSGLIIIGGPPQFAYSQLDDLPSLEIKVGSPYAAGIPPLPVPNQQALNEFQNLLFSAPVEVEIVEDGFVAALVLDADVSVPAMQFPANSTRYEPSPAFKLRVKDGYMPPQLKSINDRFEVLELK
jgi:hypothetical protein